MPVHSETRKLPYSAEQMYDLVADISAYPQFLPWCSAARIRLRATEGERETVEADLVVSFKVFRESFASRVELWSKAKRIDTQYI
jgi:coenzyme Q-binding protein COQ10